MGDQETCQIAIHSAQGKLQRLARVPAVDLSISASDVSAMKAARRVFSPNGELLGTIDLPVRFRLLDIGDDFILGVYRDDSDVEYVQLYALARGATQS